MIITKTWNSYDRHDGYVMGWERDDSSDGHHVTLMNSDGEPIGFRWRSAEEPVAGGALSVVMVKDGLTLRADRPVLVLEHDTGKVMREQNAPPPRGTRPIMLALSIWMMAALGIGLIIIAHTTGLTFAVCTLLTAALLVWRLAIATSEVRLDERAWTRIREEEKLCLDIMTSEWRLRAGEVINMKRTHAA